MKTPRQADRFLNHTEPVQSFEHLEDILLIIRFINTFEQR
jgi:hypothetical protein